MSTITKQDAIRFIQSRTMITGPGKHNLQVVNDPTPHDGRLIINLKAQTSAGLATAKELLRADDASGAANTNLTTSVFADASFIPSRGEYVAVMIEYVTSKRSGEQVLAVVSMSEIKAAVTKKVSLGEEFTNMLDEVEASVEASTDLG